MGSNEQHIAATIAKVCQKLDQKGFGANHDGNVTVKYADKIFATPTAVSKGDITPEMIITLDLLGNKIAGHGKPFSEIELHLAAYNSRPDITACVHAHPPYATARGIVGLPLNRPTIPESVVSIGDNIPVARFTMPGDAAISDIIAGMLNISNVFMIPGNGVFAVGGDLVQAYLRLELAEHLAKIDFIATTMGEPEILSDADVMRLLEKHKAAGLAAPEAGKRKAGMGRRRAKTFGLDIDIQKMIAEEVRRLVSSK